MTEGRHFEKKFEKWPHIGNGLTDCHGFFQCDRSPMPIFVIEIVLGQV